MLPGIITIQQSMGAFVAVERKFGVRGSHFVVEGIDEADPYLNGITEDFESNFQTFCRNFLEPDAVAFDIGANIGATAIVLSQYLDKGKVYAVEPGKKIFSLLEKNLRKNGIKNVQAINCAVSETTTKLRFVENSAYGHIDLTSQDEPSDDGSIDAFSLDDLVDSLKLERLNFVKVDVEGFEHQVLKGGKKTLARFNPVLYLEINSWCLLDHSNTNPLELANYLLQNFKYVYRVIKTPGASSLLERVDSARTLVHDNIVYHGSVDDVVVTNDPAKIQLNLIEAYQKCDALSAQVTSLTVERDALAAQLSGLVAERASLSAQLVRAVAERESANAQLSNLVVERDSSNAQLSNVIAERDSLNVRLNAVLASRSWRVTGWLRALRHSFK